MPFCSNCGKPNPQDALFCNNCGSQMQVQTSQHFNSNSSFKIENLKHRYCDGKGTDFHTSAFGKRCETCGGTGSIQVTIQNERLVKCNVCRGYGVVYDKSQYGTECPACHGIGQIKEKINIY